MAKKNRKARRAGDVFVRAEGDDGECRPSAYVPEKPDLSTSLLGSVFGSVTVFLVGWEHPFASKLLLSLVVTGLFVMKYVVMALSPEPYAPVTTLEVASAVEKGFPGGDDDETESFDERV